MLLQRCLTSPLSSHQRSAFLLSRRLTEATVVKWRRRAVLHALERAILPQSRKQGTSDITARVKAHESSDRNPKLVDGNLLASLSLTTILTAFCRHSKHLRCRSLSSSQGNFISLAAAPFIFVLTQLFQPTRLLPQRYPYFPLPRSKITQDAFQRYLLLRHAHALGFLDLSCSKTCAKVRR